MKKIDSYTYSAINLFRNSNEGILSTISAKKDEYPFGSFVTYISGRDRKIYFYLSDIAEHTKNIKNNPKSCLTISRNKKSGDKQDSERLTLIGNICLVDKKHVNFCKERFHTFFPESKRYAEFHGFNFYQLEIIHARWIGGFGKICWLNAFEWKETNNDWQNEEKNIINHMNSDHQNTIVDALMKQHNIKDNTVKMLSLTNDGYYTKAKEGIFFIQLNKMCKTSNDYRKELIKLAKQYK